MYLFYFSNVYLYNIEYNKKFYLNFVIYPLLIIPLKSNTNKVFASYILQLINRIKFPDLGKLFNSLTTIYHKNYYSKILTSCKKIIFCNKKPKH